VQRFDPCGYFRDFVVRQLAVTAFLPEKINPEDFFWKNNNPEDLFETW